MKLSTKFVIAAGVLALGTASIVGTGYAREPWSGHHTSMAKGSGHSGSFGMHGNHAMKMLKRFDVDGDGALTEAEIDKTRETMLSKFDGDGDGSLTLQEFQGLWLEFKRPRMVDRFQAFDEDGDGMITLDEFKSPFAYMVKRLDGVGDGKLTVQELSRGRHGGRHKHRPHSR